MVTKISNAMPKFKQQKIKKLKIPTLLSLENVIASSSNEKEEE